MTSVSITNPIAAIDPQTGDDIQIVAVEHDCDAREPLAFLVVRFASNGRLYPERIDHAIALPDDASDLESNNEKIIR